MKINIITWLILTLLLSVLGASLIAHVVEPFTAPTSRWMSPESFTLIPNNDYLDALSKYYDGLATGEEDMLALVLITTFVVLCVLLMLLWLYGMKEKPVAENSILGNFQIIESSRLRSKMNDTWDGKENPSSSGLVYGFENGHYLYDSKTPHQMVVARTGGGKSRYSMLETVHLGLEAGCNLTISDLKNEIIELTGERAAQVGNVVLCDLENPLNGNHYNPLDLVVNYAEASDIVNI